MLLAFLKGLLTGAAFGVVLYKVGATRYSRVMGMLTLRDTKVMKFAFTAVATGAFIYGAAASFGVAEAWGLVPRIMPFTGWAHVVGGVLFGVAMGATGYCPGTCATKTGGRGGEKKFGPGAALVGLVAGILVYNLVKTPLMDAGVIATNQKPITLHGLLGLPYGALALIAGAVFLLISFAVDRFTPEAKYEPARERKTAVDYLRGEWSWLASGVAGGVLVVLATAQDGYLGFSGAVLAAVGWAASAVGLPLEVVPKITPEIAWRAALILGAIGGGVLAHVLSIPSKAAAEQPAPKVFDPKALGISFTAGLALSLGAMIGGGCTTGAFIAAWPTLSVGSFAMGGTFFAVSMITSNLRIALRTLDLPRVQLAGDRAYD